MSDLEALYIFLNRSITTEMIHFLCSTTTSIIQVDQKTQENALNNYGYPSPPQSPTKSKHSIPSLYHFIKSLIEHSHVQVTTLMTTLIYLNRLKEVIPPNSVGMETTHHRIFLGSLLIAAKYTNDSSPMNKHWTTYTDGLLTLREVNALEIEMIQYIGWDHLRFQNEDLIKCLAYFLEPIKRKLRMKQEHKITDQLNQLQYVQQQEREQQQQHRELLEKQRQQREQQREQQHHSLTQSSTSSSLPSLVSSTSTSSSSTFASLMSATLPRKGSMQSLQSEIKMELESPSVSALEKDNNLRIPLRPLRLKPQNKPSAIPNTKRMSSVNLAAIDTLNSSLNRMSLNFSSIDLNEPLQSI